MSAVQRLVHTLQRAEGCTDGGGKGSVLGDNVANAVELLKQTEIGFCLVQRGDGTGEDHRICLAALTGQNRHGPDGLQHQINGAGGQVGGRGILGQLAEIGGSHVGMQCAGGIGSNVADGQVDLMQIAVQSQLLDLTAYPLLATHSNFREICASPRNLPRDLASKIAARGGVIGINLYSPFLNESGEATDTDILRHVDFGLENYGESAIGFGFDIDGTDGRYPLGYGGDSIHDRVCDMLLSHYSASVVDRIAGGNVIDFCKNNL